MINFDFQEVPRLSEINIMHVQGHNRQDMTWIEERHEVLIKFYCTDGICYVVLDRKPVRRE
jgi:hypothetical protein